MKFIDTLTKYISYTTALALGLLVILVVYNAVLRYFFSNSSTAIQELQWHLFDGIILFGIAYTLKNHAHVRVDIFYEHFSEKIKLLINILSYFLFILPFALVIIYVSYDFVQMSYVQHEVSTDAGGLPYRWIVKSLIPLSFVFVALQAVKELYTSIYKWRTL